MYKKLFFGGNLLLFALLVFGFIKIVNSSFSESPYRLDSLFFKHIFYQFQGNSYDEARKKVLGNNPVNWQSEVILKNLYNDESYRQAFEFQIKRPFYPFMAFLISGLIKNEYLAFLIPVIVSSLGFVVFFYLIAKTTLKTVAAVIAGLLIFQFSPFVLASAQFMADMIGAFFWMVQLFLIFKFVKSGERVWIFVFGFVVGLSLLNREHSLLMLPLTVIAAFCLRFFFKDTVKARRLLILAGVCAIFVLIYVTISQVFGYKNFVDTIVYLQNHFGYFDFSFTFFQRIQFYFGYLIQANTVLLEGLIMKPWRLFFILLALLGIFRAVSDRKNREVNTLFFASAIASYLAIFFYPWPNLRYFFPLAAAVLYFAVYYVFKTSLLGLFRNRKNRKIIVLGGLFLTIFVIVGINLGIFKSEKQKLKELLVGVDIDKIEFSGRNYSLKNGVLNNTSNSSVEVLRLAAFYQWNKEDPLFTSPDFNYIGLERSIDDLEKYHKDLLDFVGRTEQLHPLGYLKAMIGVAKTDKSFMDGPNFDIAISLIDKQMETARLYKQEALNLRSKVEQSPYFSPVSINVTTNKNIVASDLSKIIKNADELEREIGKRRACLLGFGRCIRPAFRFEEPKAVKDAEELEPKLLDKQVVFFDTPKGAKNTIRGPYAVKTPCFSWAENFTYPEQYFYVQYLPEGRLSIKSPIANIQLATDIFLEKISQQTTSEGRRRLLDEGIPYIYFPSTTPYNCFYAGYLTEVLTVDQFFTSKKPIFPKTDFFKDAVVAEEDFFGSQFPSYEKLLQLGQFYAYYYRLSLDRRSPLELVQLKDELLLRKLEIERKLSNNQLLFDYFNIFVRGITIIKEQDSESIQDFTSNILYPFRSYYGLMYFPFTKSVWRLDDDLQYAQKVKFTGVVGVGLHYLDWWSAIEVYPQELLKSWLIPRGTIVKGL